MLTSDEIAAIPTAFPTTLVPPKTARFMPLVDALEEWNAVERMGRITSMLIDLGDVEVPIVVEECGETNAYYSTGERRIHVCYELIELSAQLAGSPTDELTDELNDDVIYLIEFITLHEIGHALIDLMRLRIGDHEEELRADQFASLMLTNHKDAALTRAVMHAFTKFFVEFDQLESHDDDSVEAHGRSKDRATFSLCVVWRRNRPPSIASSMAGELGRTCDDYADDARETWNAWLAPHTRIDTGKTF